MTHEVVNARKRVIIISYGTKFGLELADWLASDGYEVAIARQADEAVEQLSTIRPDRIVLDRHLPIADGLEALRLIKLQCPQVPVFTMTETTSRAHSCLKAGARGSSFFLTPLQGSVTGTLLDALVRG
jgi:DNA-binding response OmpR family regulator